MWYDVRVRHRSLDPVDNDLKSYKMLRYNILMRTHTARKSHVVQPYIARRRRGKFFIFFKTPPAPHAALPRRPALNYDTPTDGRPLALSYTCLPYYIAHRRRRVYTLYCVLLCTLCIVVEGAPARCTCTRTCKIS